MQSGWDEEMETGNAHMDEQHRRIIELVNDLKGHPLTSSGDVFQLLERVMDLTVTHFLTEEALMEECGYPGNQREEMLEQHDEFKAYARLRVLEFRKGSDHETVASLHDFLRHWLIEHEFGLDRKLVDWIRLEDPAHWMER